MFPSRKALAATLVVACFACPGVAAERDPAAEWVSVYGWLQTGEQLAEAGQWPLALGAWMESHQRLDALAEAHPSFEPEMVEYRLEWLEAEIAAARSELSGGEHGIMMKFLDFIESFQRGQDLRFAGEYEKALNELDVARVLLDEIIAEKPDAFREAVSTQAELLDDSIAWCDSQINFEQRSRPTAPVSDGVDWGTTEFVEREELPAESDGEMVVASGRLFPGVPVDAGAASGTESSSGDEKGAEKEKSDGAAPERERAPEGGFPYFRMNTGDSEQDAGAE